MDSTEQKIAVVALILVLGGVAFFYISTKKKNDAIEGLIKPVIEVGTKVVGTATNILSSPFGGSGGQSLKSGDNWRNANLVKPPPEGVTWVGSRPTQEPPAPLASSWKGTPPPNPVPGVMH